MLKKLRLFGDLSWEGSSKSLFLQYPPLRFCSSLTTSKNPVNFCLTKFLRESCGIAAERVPAISKALQGRTLRRPDSLPAFLRNEGFSKTQIAELISKRPVLLHSRVEYTLKPKFEFFREKGLSRSEVADFVSSNPGILWSHLEKCMRPLYDFLLQGPTVGSDVSVREIFEILSVCNMKWYKFVANVVILREHGVPDNRILEILRRRTRMMWCPEARFRGHVKRVVELGFNPSSHAFMDALRVLSQVSSSTLEAKFKVFESFGWSSEDVLSAFRRNPPCISLSEEKLRRNFDFLSKELGWEGPVVSIHPTLLSYSVEKRLVPRLLILEALQSKNLIKNISANQFMVSDTDFQNKYVIKYHVEFPGVLELYRSSFGLKEFQRSKSKQAH